MRLKKADVALTATVCKLKTGNTLDLQIGLLTQKTYS